MRDRRFRLSFYRGDDVLCGTCQLRQNAPYRCVWVRLVGKEARGGRLPVLAVADGHLQATLDGSDSARPPAVYPPGKTVANAASQGVAQTGRAGHDLKFRPSSSGVTIDASSGDEDDRLLGGSVDSSDPSWSLGVPASYVRVVAPDSYPKEHHKLVCVAFAFLLAAASNWAALAYIHDYVGR
jgi:hypothetical protein